jgi:hypothetical protein
MRGGKSNGSWTISEYETGEALAVDGDPVLFDSYEQALAWANEHIDPDDAREYAIEEIR